jgi:hypothetical protein
MRKNITLEASGRASDDTDFAYLQTMGQPPDPRSGIPRPDTDKFYR